MNIDERKEKILQRLAKNAAALSLTQIARVGFNTILSLLIARQLGAEGFGKYGVLIAYLHIFQVLAMMGMPRLVVREMARRPHEGRDWFHRTVVNQVLGAGGSAVILILVASLLNHPADTTQSLVIGVLSLFPFALSSAAESAFRAREQMGLIALAQIGSVGVQTVGSILVLLAGQGIVALAWMIVLGQLVVAVVEVGITRRMKLWQGFRVDLRGAIRLLRQSFDFFLASFSVVVFSRLDVLVLSQMVGERAVGVYNAAYLIVRVINFISVSYSDAVYPVLSRLFDEAHARFEALLCKSILFGTTITLLIAILLATAAEPIVALLYRNKEYGVSVSLLYIEASLVVILMWNALLSKALMASNLQRYSVVVAGVKLGAAGIYYVLLTGWLGTMGTAVATVLAAFTGTVLNYYFLNKKVCSLDWAALVAKPLAIGAILVVILWMARGLAWPGLVVGGTVLYASLLVVFHVFSRDDIRLFRQMIWPL